MSLRVFQGLTGGGGGLSTWRPLSIQRMPLHQIMQSRKNDFLFFLISEGSSKGERRSENAAWLCGFEFIPFLLLISEIPFELGYTAFFFSSTTVRQKPRRGRLLQHRGKGSGV